MVHGGFGFVAHVGEAEGGAFYFSVTAVDEEALIPYEFLELGDVNGASAGFSTVVDAGEGEGFEAFFRKQSEAVARGPVAGHLGELGVAGIAGFEAFGEKFIQLGGEGVGVADARRAGGHAAFGIFLELDKIKVVTAVFDGGGLGERSGRSGKHGEAGRHGEGFLRSREQDIDAKGVEFNFSGSQGADGVDDEHDVRIFFLERGDFGERAHRAGGGFVVDEREGVELAGGEFGIDGGGADGRAPIDLEGFGLLAATQGDVEPFVRESAAHAVEDLFGHEIADGTFHDAPGGGGAEIDQLFGVQEGLQLGLDFGVEVFEALAAMANHRRAESAKRFLADFDRSRNVEFDVCHK
ncbi:MAG: hypothetical protein JWR19_3627 [Pedosphaera sp.]|nr:hypothetical protein [Pedosphaera sp.]